MRARRDALPHPRQGEQVVARKRKDGAAAGLEAGDGDEVHDGEAGEGEEDGGGAAHGGEEELRDGLAAGAVDEVEGVAHAEDEDEVEEEADEVGGGGGVGDGFGDDTGGVFGFFGDAGSGLVWGVSMVSGGGGGLPCGAVGACHDPRWGQAAEQEGEPRGGPAGSGLEVGKSVLDRVLVRGLCQQGSAGADENADMEDNVATGQSIQPDGGERVDGCVDHGEESHDSHNVLPRWQIREIGDDGDGGEQELARRVLCTGAARDGSDEVDIACRRQN